jgi:hypothetical protein
LRIPYAGYVIPGTEAISLFNEAESYGPKIMKKVKAYAHVVDLMSEKNRF